MIRTISALIMLGSILWGYWWLTLILAVLLLFYFPVYYEIILWGVIYDALYGTSLPMFYGSAHVFSIVSIALFLLSFFLRKRLIMYDDKF